MKYYHPMKMIAMIRSRAIEKKLPCRFMSLDPRTKDVAVSITTPDNARVEVLASNLPWEQLPEKLPNWISKYSIGGLVLGNITKLPTGYSSLTLKERHDFIEKLKNVRGIEDGMPYTFVEFSEEDVKKFNEEDVK